MYTPKPCGATPRQRALRSAPGTGAMQARIGGAALVPRTSGGDSDTTGSNAFTVVHYDHHEPDDPLVQPRPTRVRLATPFPVFPCLPRERPLADSLPPTPFSSFFSTTPACRRPASGPPAYPWAALPDLSGRSRKGRPARSGGRPFLESPGVMRVLGPEVGRRRGPLQGGPPREDHPEGTTRRRPPLRDGPERVGSR
jgi:hypothetical protein